MKKKQLISILAILALVLSLGAGAFADAPEYKSTKAFVEMMDDNQYRYDFYPKEEDGDSEIVFAEYQGDYMDDLSLSAFFPDTEDEMFLYCFNMIDFDEADYLKALEAVNELNHENDYACFYVDTDDYSINAYWSVLLGEKDAKEIAEIALHSFLNAVDDSYDRIKSLEK